MPAQNAGGTGGGNLAAQGRRDRSRFARSRNRANQGPPGHQCWTREGDGLPGHGLNVGENYPSRLHLLLPDRLRRALTDFGHAGIGKVSDRRIVESNVSVLANAQTNEVNRPRREQRGITRAFRRRVGTLSANAMKDRRRHAGQQMSLLIMAKRGGMRGGQADVFVQVEERNAAPINARGGGQARNQFILRWRAAQNDTGGAALPDDETQAFPRRGSPPQRPSRCDPEKCVPAGDQRRMTVVS